MLKKGGPYFSPMGKFGSFSPKEVFILFFLLSREKEVQLKNSSSSYLWCHFENVIQGPSRGAK